MLHRFARLTRPAALSLLLLGGLAAGAQAQPFGTWGVFSTSGSFVQVDDANALDPNGEFTFEAWVNITNNPAGEDCRSIAGKNYLQAWWIGLCTVDGQPRLRSYLQGGTSGRTGGYLTRNQWTHIAVTYDGANRRHYINGELAATFSQTGSLPDSDGQAMRIGSDVAWQVSPAGSIDEVRLWNVARSLQQIRANLNEQIRSAQPGLVAVWAFDAGSLGADVIGSNDGSVTGVTPGIFPALASCLGSPNCRSDKFLVTVRYRTGNPPGPDSGAATIGASNADSAIYWFFTSNNWELLLKVLDACLINDRYWVFAAGVTDRFFRIEVLDVAAGVQKIYFNYPGSPAPALTDTDAFDTCL